MKAPGAGLLLPGFGKPQLGTRKSEAYLQHQAGWWQPPRAQARLPLGRRKLRRRVRQRAGALLKLFLRDKSKVPQARAVGYCEPLFQDPSAGPDNQAAWWVLVDPPHHLCLLTD